MIFIKSLFCALFLCLCSCSWLSEDSFFTDEQAEIICAILNENGYSVDNHEDVDKYVEFGSSSEHVDLNDYYWLVLPEKRQTTLVLTDKINDLDNKFHGVKSPPRFYDTVTNGNVKVITNYGLVDSLYIDSNNFINIKILSIHNNMLKDLPKTIQCLRGKVFNFSYNKITSIPVEATNITNTPKLYDTVSININYNRIDTTNVDPVLDAWLVEHAGPYWKAGQRHQE